MYNTTPHVWKVFGGAVDDVGTEAVDQRASAVENFYRRRYRLVSRLGTASIANLGVDRDVDGLQWNAINGVEYLLTVFNGDVRNGFSNPTSALPGGSARFTAGDDANMAWIDQRVFLGTGKAQNVYYDGSRVYQALPDQPGATTNFVGVAASGLLTGTYAYAVTFVNPAGDYSVPRLVANSVILTANQIKLANIPLAPAGQDSTGRQIWRTDANGGTYFLLTTISDNTTTTYTDNIPDASLGITALLFENTRFPPCRYLSEWGNRLAGAGCLTNEGDNQTLYISNVRQPWYCPLLPNSDTPGAIDPNQGVQLVVQDRSAGGWTGLAVHGGVLMAFTGGAGHIVAQLQNGGFHLQKFCEHGCAAHRTIVSAKALLIWLSWDGVYAWDGNVGGDNVTRISDEEYNTVIAENSSNLSKASAFFWDGRYYLCLPDRTLVYDLNFSQWSTIVNASIPAVWSWRVTTTTVYTADQKPRIYAAPVGLGQLWQAETGYTDGGFPIPLRWRSGDTDLGSSGPIPTKWDSFYFPGGGEFRQKRVIFIGANFKAAPGQTATINLYEGTAEANPIDSYPWDLGQTTDREGIVGTTNSQVSRFYDRAVEGARGEFFAMEIVVPATAPVEFLQAEAHFVTIK